MSLRIPELRTTVRRRSLIILAASLVSTGCMTPAVLESQAPSGTAPAARPTSAPTPTSSAVSGIPTPTTVFLRVLVDGLRIRQEPDTGSRELAQLRSGDMVAAVAGDGVVAGGREWYPIHHGTYDGWIATGSSDDPWLGEPASPAESEVVLRVDYDIDVSNLMGRNKLMLFADGRLLVPHEVTGIGWSERWLTRAGVDHVISDALSTGLFAADTFFEPARPEYVAITSVMTDTDNGPVTVSVNAPPETAGAELLLDLADRLLNYSSWLPAEMFVSADALPQDYVIPRYLFTVTYAPDQPPDIAESQRGRGEIDAIELPPGIELVDGGCSLIDRATFAVLRQIMFDSGFGPESSTDVGGGWWVGWAAGNGSVLLQVMAVPPGSEADCRLQDAY